MWVGAGLKPSQRSYSDLEALFLLRLFRLVRLRTTLPVEEGDPVGRNRLVDSAIVSILQDCEALGLRGEAHALLESESEAGD